VVPSTKSLETTTIEPIQEETKAEILKLDDESEKSKPEMTEINSEPFKEVEKTKAPSFVKYLTPVQKILSQSVNFLGNEIKSKNSLERNFFDSDHEMLKKEALAVKRASSTDFFTTKKTDENDKKLSGKIINELMNFVQVERTNGNANKHNGLIKSKKEKFPKIKDTQVLTFDD
jgi:hypothetical protein